MTKLRYFLALLVLLAGIEATAGQANGLRPPGLDSARHIGLFTAPADDGLGAEGSELSRFSQGSVFGRYDSGMRTSQGSIKTAQNDRADVIPPSVALRVALSYSPGSQGLGVNLQRGRRLVYAVKLKTGNRVHRVLVDARTGQVVGD